MPLYHVICTYLELRIQNFVIAYEIDTMLAPEEEYIHIFLRRSPDDSGAENTENESSLRVRTSGFGDKTRR